MTEMLAKSGYIPVYIYVYGYLQNIVIFTKCNLKICLIFNLKDSLKKEKNYAFSWKILVYGIKIT